VTASPHSKSAGPRASYIVGAWLAAVSGLVAAVPASAGPIGFQGSGGWNSENEDFCLGAGARVGAGPVTLIPNAEWFFVDSGSTYALSLDGTLNVLPLGVAAGYLGAGTGMFTVKPDGGESNTEAVLNLIAGVGLNAVPLRPFAQIKWIVIDGDDPFVFSVGARF